jgi:hypothetical protein
MTWIDVSSFVALLVTLMLVGCVAALMSMLDRANQPLHVTRRLIWCPHYKRTTTVEFSERLQTGMALRTVRHCPLRREGEPCGEGCACESGVVPTP